MISFHPEIAGERRRARAVPRAGRGAAEPASSSTSPATASRWPTSPTATRRGPRATPTGCPSAAGSRRAGSAGGCRARGSRRSSPARCAARRRPPRRSARCSACRSRPTRTCTRSASPTRSTPGCRTRPSTPRWPGCRPRRATRRRGRGVLRRDRRPRGARAGAPGGGRARAHPLRHPLGLPALLPRADDVRRRLRPRAPARHLQARPRQHRHHDLQPPRAARDRRRRSGLGADHLERSRASLRRSPSSSSRPRARGLTTARCSTATGPPTCSTRADKSPVAGVQGGAPASYGARHGGRRRAPLAPVLALARRQPAGPRHLRDRAPRGRLGARAWSASTPPASPWRPLRAAQRRGALRLAGGEQARRCARGLPGQRVARRLRPPAVYGTGPSRTRMTRREERAHPAPTPRAHQRAQPAMDALLRVDGARAAPAGRLESSSRARTGLPGRALGRPGHVRRERARLQGGPLRRARRMRRARAGAGRWGRRHPRAAGPARRLAAPPLGQRQWHDLDPAPRFRSARRVAPPTTSGSPACSAATCSAASRCTRR